MTEQTKTVDAGSLQAKTRLGVWVAVGLAVLTLIEYFIAIGVDSPLLWLLPFVLAKGWLIMRYFMHVQEVMGGEH